VISNANGLSWRYRRGMPEKVSGLKFNVDFFAGYSA
jgi:hypothetical protein